MLLTDLLLLLSASAIGVAVFIWLAEKLGVHDGLHDVMPGFCPCGGAA